MKVSTGKREFVLYTLYLSASNRALIRTSIIPPASPLLCSLLRPCCGIGTSHPLLSTSDTLAGFRYVRLLASPSGPTSGATGLVGQSINVPLYWDVHPAMTVLLVARIPSGAAVRRILASRDSSWVMFTQVRGERGRRERVENGSVISVLLRGSDGKI